MITQSDVPVSPVDSWHHENTESVFTLLEASANGLSEEEAKKDLKSMDQTGFLNHIHMVLLCALCINFIIY